MNTVEQEMWDQLHGIERNYQETAEVCAKVAEDVAIAFYEWLANMDLEEAYHLPPGGIKECYDHFINQVYKRQ